MIKKLTHDELKSLQTLLAENHLRSDKFTIKELSVMSNISEAVITYYKGKWGYSAKQRKHKKHVPQEKEVSLSKAIEICKKNGLRVIREVTTTEEL